MTPPPFRDPARRCRCEEPIETGLTSPAVLALEVLGAELPAPAILGKRLRGALPRPRAPAVPPRPGPYPPAPAVVTTIDVSGPTASEEGLFAIRFAPPSSERSSNRPVAPGPPPNTPHGAFTQRSPWPLKFTTCPIGR